MKGSDDYTSFHMTTYTNFWYTVFRSSPIVCKECVCINKSISGLNHGHLPVLGLLGYFESFLLPGQAKMIPELLFQFLSLLSAKSYHFLYSAISFFGCAQMALQNLPLSVGPVFLPSWLFIITLLNY